MEKIRGCFILSRDLTYLNNWNSEKKRKPVILRGARQVGKSTLVRLFAKEQGLRLAEINLERHPLLDQVFASLNLDTIVPAIEAICKQHFDDKNTLLFLDEIQATPNALAALRYFFEDRPNLRVIAAGSLLEFVLSDHKFSMPVGRVAYHWLRPMSFLEFLLARGEEFLAEKWSRFEVGQNWPESLHLQLWEQYRWYLIIGGMPEAVAAFVSEGAKEGRIRKIHDNIIASYADDFAKYARQSDLMRLQSVYRQLPKSLGEKVKYSTVLPDEKTMYVKRAIDLLSMAGIIHRVVHTNCSGILLRANMDDRIYKLYWLDVGLLNRMHGLSWSAVSSQQALISEGLLAEQFVAQELLTSQNTTDPPPLCYWLREGKRSNAEVDFVVQQDLDIIPIEVKSGSPGTFKSLAHLVSKIQAKRAVRFSNVLPRMQKMKINVPIGPTMETVEYELVNLPVYLAGKYVVPQ